MRNNKLYIQKTISFTLAFLLSFYPILTLINLVTNFFLPPGFIYDTILLYIVLAVLISYSLILIIPSFKVDVIILFLFIIFAYLITYLLYENNRIFMFTNVLDLLNNPLYILFFYSFTGYVLMRHIDDLKIFLGIFKIFSIVVVASSLIILLDGIRIGVLPQYMVFSYNMLSHTIFLFVLSREKRNFVYLIISLVGAVLIFVAGARGPIVILVLTILVYEALRKTSILRKIILFSSLLLMVFAFFAMKDLLINFVEYISIHLNFDSRTITYILTGRFFESSGRDDILLSLVDKISLFGSGLYSDRAFSGFYAHNLFFEIILGFGLIFGPILIVAIVIFVYKALFSKNNDLFLLSIPFFASGFLKLFLSGSYLNQEPAFYVLLALGVNAYLQRSLTIRKQAKC